MKEFIARKSLLFFAKKNPVLILGYLAVAISPLVWTGNFDSFEKFLAPIVSFSLFALLFVGIGFELFYRFFQPEKLISYQLASGKIIFKAKSGSILTKDLKVFQSLYLVSEYRRPATLVFSRETHKPQYYKSPISFFSFKTTTLEVTPNSIEFLIDLVDHSLEKQLEAIGSHAPHLTDGRFFTYPSAWYRLGLGTHIQ